MENGFESLNENKLGSVGIGVLEKICGCNSAVINNYVNDLDALRVRFTEHYTSKWTGPFYVKTSDEMSSEQNSLWIRCRVRR